MNNLAPIVLGGVLQGNLNWMQGYDNHTLQTKSWYNEDIIEDLKTDDNIVK